MNITTLHNPLYSYIVVTIRTKSVQLLQTCEICCVLLKNTSQRLIFSRTNAFVYRRFTFENCIISIILIGASSTTFSCLFSKETFKRHAFLWVNRIPASRLHISWQVNTVEPRFNELPRDRGNAFVISRVR